MIIENNVPLKISMIRMKFKCVKVSISESLIQYRDLFKGDFLSHQRVNLFDYLLGFSIYGWWVILLTTSSDIPSELEPTEFTGWHMVPAEVYVVLGWWQ